MSAPLPKPHYKQLIIVSAIYLAHFALIYQVAAIVEEPSSENSENDEYYRHVDCGTIATNMSKILVRNQRHPEPTYVKSICETVIERALPSVSKLRLNFKQLELYRPNADGRCQHDRFAVYTDLNVAVSPIICGNHTGESITVPFEEPQAGLIVSVTTSDLDHDRWWQIEIEQLA